jgi:hypothetical protein
MSEQQPISFAVPEAGFDLTLLPEKAREPGSEAFRAAVIAYYKDAYREAGGRVDVAFCDGRTRVVRNGIDAWVYCQLLSSDSKAVSARVADWQQEPNGSGGLTPYTLDPSDLVR